MRPPSKRLGKPAWPHLGAFALYLILSVGMTWPVAAHLTDRLAGYPADNRLFVWTLWVVRQGVLAGRTADLELADATSGAPRLPLRTDQIFHPEGVSLALHTSVVPKSLPATVLLSFASPTVVFNALLLASITLCGYSAWVLVHDLTGDRLAAILGGIAFALSPVVLAHASAGHLNLVSAEGLPLFVFFFLRGIKAGRWWDAALAGVAAAYAGLSDWTYMIFLILFTGIHLAYQAATSRASRGRSHLRWPILRQYGITAIVACAGSAALLMPAIQESSATEYDLTRYIGGSALYVSDLAGFLTPSPDHAIVGRLVSPVSVRFAGGAFEGTVYLGLTVLVLAAVGFHHLSPRHGRFWLIVALTFGVLSLGPGLHVLGQFRFPGLAWLRMGSVAQHLGVPMKAEWVRLFDEAPMIPLPGAMLHLLPGLKWMRAPSRFVIMSMLALAVLAGAGCARVRQRLRARRWLRVPAPALATGMLCGTLLLEFCVVPFPTTPTSQHPFHDQLISQPGDFAILELPIEPFALLPQYWQTSHGKRLGYGHISRLPEERFRYLERLSAEVLQPTGFFELVDIRFLVLHESRLASLDPREASALVAALDANYMRAWSAENAGFPVTAYCAYDDAGFPCLSRESP